LLFLHPKSNRERFVFNQRQFGLDELPGSRQYEPTGQRSSMQLTEALDRVCEVELLAQVSQQDADAFARLYDRTAPILYGIAKSIMRDAALAEDVVQEAYSIIWEKASMYRPSLGKPISWMIALTRNRALDRLRSVHRQEHRLQRDATVEDAVSGGKDAPQLMFEAEAAGALRSALRTLDANQRRALELAFFEGLPHGEVAAAMNEPLGTVKAWIRRGMLELRPKLENFL
jgi:RNA polymerase sigma-70 factor (ECF subfamily)